MNKVGISSENELILNGYDNMGVCIKEALMTLRDTNEDENGSNTISSILAIYIAKKKEKR